MKRENSTYGHNALKSTFKKILYGMAGKRS